ncbi:hypothetical protein WJX74_010447 [Apatococcus lobatus]|uniref:Protein kinase domain-containing protein n=1 Tax=Apatococcus lobatus TaxID=904363 RepID=A0AAW1RYG7_9CHLO
MLPAFPLLSAGPAADSDATAHLSVHVACCDKRSALSDHLVGLIMDYVHQEQTYATGSVQGLIRHLLLSPCRLRLESTALIPAAAELSATWQPAEDVQEPVQTSESPDSQGEQAPHESPYHLLAQGSFGVVYKTNSVVLGIVAVKVQLRAHAEAELQGHEALIDSPYCLHLLGYTDGDVTEGRAACLLGVDQAELMSLVMPLCSQGSWADVLARNSDKRDNWLVDGTGCLKLADFGGLQSCSRANGRQDNPATRTYTAEFCPPEMFHDHWDPKGWEDDAWAAGCSLTEVILQQEMWTRDPETGACSQTKGSEFVATRIRSALDALPGLYTFAEATDLVFEAMQNTIRGLMHPDPEQRLGGRRSGSFRNPQQALICCDWSEEISAQDWADYLA